MIDPAEKAAADYLLSLSAEDRKAAEKRINQLLLADTPPDQSAPDIPVITLEEFLADPITRPPQLITNGEVVEGEITALIGRGGKGKTTLMMNRAVRWAAGLPLFENCFLSQAPCEPHDEHGLRILIIENEGVAYFQQEHFSMIVQHALQTPEQRAMALNNVMIWGDAGYSGLKVDSDNDLDLIHRAVKEFEPHILIMEPFRGLWSGEENDASEMEKVLDRMLVLANEYNCGILLSHHSRKSEAGEDNEWLNASRGSGVLEGKCAVMENYRSVRGGAQRELSWSKNRYYKAHEPLRMTFEDGTWCVSYVAEEIKGNEVLRVMEALPQEWCYVEEIAEEIHETHTGVFDILKELLKEDRVIRGKDAEHKNGKWRLAVKNDNKRKGLSISDA